MIMSSLLLFCFALWTGGVLTDITKVSLIAGNTTIGTCSIEAIAGSIVVALPTASL